MKSRSTLWQLFGITSLGLLAACGADSSVDDPRNAAGSAGNAGVANSAGKSGQTSTAGASGTAGASTGGSAGKNSAGTAGTGGKAGASGKAGAGNGGTGNAAGTSSGGVGGGAGDGNGGSGDAAGTGNGGGDAGTGQGGAGDAAGANSGGNGEGGDAGTGTGGSGETGGTGVGGGAAMGGNGTGNTSGTGTGNTGGTGTGNTGGTGTGNTGGVGTGGSGNVGGSSTAGNGNGGTGNFAGFCPFPPCTGGFGGTCDSKNGEDKDGDGFTFPNDCNDCDPSTNPGALDVYNFDPETGKPLPSDQQIDEDCNGSATLKEKNACDQGIALGENDPIKGANAIDLCQKAMGQSWGIVSANYVQLDGKPLPPNAAIDPQLGHGIMKDFGSAVTREFGDNMLVLSSGTARTPKQPGYQYPGVSNKDYATDDPTGFPVESTTCPSTNSGPLRDSIALKLRLRAPTNARSFSFRFKFYTYEFPGFVCTKYNDIFIATVRDKKGQFLPGADPKTGNISFDKDKNYLSVNTGFLDVCDPQTAGGKQFSCPKGPGELAGTGFDAASDELAGQNHGGTRWLQTIAPVTPGEEFDILFGITDAGDGILTSTVLIDSFQWSANEGVVQTGDACKLGGSGTCGSCLSTGIPYCCLDQLQACQSDTANDPTDQFNPGCSGLLNCIEICAGNDACQQSCYDDRPAGQPKYNAYRDCLYGPAGSTDDFGACGKSCQ